VLVVLDTNILFQALYSKKGASFQILTKIFSTEIEIAISVPVFLEYEAVLKRKTSLEQFELTSVDIEGILTAIAYVGKKFGIFFRFAPNLRDETDNKFIDLAMRASVDYIITSNIRDFTYSTDLKITRERIQTPANFLKIWRKKNE